MILSTMILSNFFCRAGTGNALPAAVHRKGSPETAGRFSTVPALQFLNNRLTGSIFDRIIGDRIIF